VEKVKIFLTKITITPTLMWQKTFYLMAKPRGIRGIISLSQVKVKKKNKHFLILVNNCILSQQNITETLP